MQERKSAFLVLLAGTLWGLISLFVHGLSDCGMQSLPIVCFRNVLAALILGVWLAVRNPALLKIRLRDSWMFLGTGIVSIALFNYCYFVTLQHTSVAAAVLLMYTSPVFVMLLARLLFGELLTRRKLIALVMTILGCACVTGMFSESRTIPAVYLLTGLGSGLFYGMYSIFGKKALARYRTETVSFYTFAVAAAATFPFSVGNCVSVVTVHPETMLMGLGLALFCTVLPFLCYTAGLNGIPASRAAIFATVEPLVGTVAGIVAFDDPFSIWTALGILLVLTAIALMNTPSRAWRKQHG